MIDLSNNNGSVDFKRLHAQGFRRVYLKRSEGIDFVDGKHDSYRTQALLAGLKVGEYHFARPSKNTAKREAEFFCSLLPKLRPGKALRPCLDLEDTGIQPSLIVAQWAQEFIGYVKHETGHTVVLYSNPSYLAGCKFHHPTGPLWIASYGRDDGKEHPYQLPAPWKKAAAHQYTSHATVAGVQGDCDVSHVLHPFQLDVHRWPAR